MKVAQKIRTLSNDDVRRAIYIDFEGNKDRTPTVLGILYQDDDGTDTLEQLVLERRFDGAVGGGAATRSAHIVGAARELVRRANRERRRIVSWSDHDRKKLLAALGERALASRVMALHRNAIVTARRWARLQEVRFEANALNAYLQHIAYRVPTEHGPGRTGSTLRALRESLVTHKGDWSRLTPNARARFDDLLGHNRHDLHGMREVLRLATMDVEIAKAPAGSAEAPAGRS